MEPDSGAWRTENNGDSDNGAWHHEYTHWMPCLFEPLQCLFTALMASGSTTKTQMKSKTNENHSMSIQRGTLKNNEWKYIYYIINYYMWKQRIANENNYKNKQNDTIFL